MIETVEIRLSVSVIFGGDNEASRLHRHATVLKRAGDWEGAIAALKEAKDFMMTSNIGFTAATWYRLAVFLQYAGRYEESMTEFQFLLDDLDRRGRHEYDIGDGKISCGGSKVELFKAFKKSDRWSIKAERKRVQAREEKRLKKLAAG